jgi:1-acyl-sn-glycerol-3-phosphate acyltransferase
MTTTTSPTGITLKKPSPFFQTLGRFIARLMGWTVRVNLPDDPKMVLVFFPHTSNMDVIVAIPAAFSIGLKPNWLVKDEITRGPLKPILERIGAIPINRHVKENKVEQIARAIQNADQVMLALSPEGTRSRMDYWRTGFYHIARLAEVPIHFAYIDYPSKTIGAEPGFVPTGDMEADMERIQAFYADKRGKFPEKGSPIRFKPN